LTDSLVGTS